MAEINYNRKITASEKSYDEVTAFIGGLSKKVGYSEAYTHYFLDDGKLQVIRTKIGGRTIEIGDKVDPEIIRSIEHIVKTEIRGSDRAR